MTDSVATTRGRRNLLIGRRIDEYDTDIVDRQELEDGAPS